MSNDTRVKICGLRDDAGLTAAVDAGANYVGFVFFPKSPRHLELPQAAALALNVPTGVAKVALVVNADDAMLDALTQAVPLDMLQLHGAETPERVDAIKARYGLPVMKALGIAEAADLDQIDVYGEVADQLLIETKPSKDAKLPGGNGIVFDWTLMTGRRVPVPWMLAGGLDTSNVGEAIRLTGTRQVDVSSGVESSAGVKDAQMIADFCNAARAS